MSGFHHEAVFYRDDDEYLAGTLPALRDAIARDGATLVAVSGAKRQLLRSALGSDADGVAFADMERLGRNPACIIPAWREFLRDAGAGPIVGVGEPVWPGRTDDELEECSRHESLLNLAFDGGRAWRLLCPYDAAALPGDVLEEACRNHPHLARNAERWASDRYAGARAVLTRGDALPAPARPPAELEFGEHDVALVRDFIAARGSDAGFDAQRVADLVLAVNELVTNTMRHAGGAGVLRTWQDGTTFYCEVRDGGQIADPLVGRERPADALAGGRGLWIVNQLCDLVQVRSSPAGSVVRVHMSLA